jgi:hypothetical protein
MVADSEVLNIYLLYGIMIKNHAVPTQQFTLFKSTEFGENLSFHSGKFIFHMAEHINSRNRWNNRNPSWLRILAQYQKNVNFFGVVENTTIFRLAKQSSEPCYSRTLHFIT